MTDLYRNGPPGSVSLSVKPRMASWIPSGPSQFAGTGMNAMATPYRMMSDRLSL